MARLVNASPRLGLISSAFSAASRAFSAASSLSTLSASFWALLAALRAASTTFWALMEASAASAEIEGRSYGGGVLELEPTEAEKLLMPAKLGPAMSIQEADRLVREDRLADVLEENNRLVLMGQMGLSRNDCRLLQTVWEKMRDRRLGRRRAKRTPGK